MNRTLFKQFNLLHIGVFIIDEEYKVVFWNNTIAEWTGIDRIDIENQCLMDFFPNLRHRKYTRRLKWVIQGGPPIIFAPQLHPHLIKCPLPEGRDRIVKTIISNIQSNSDKSHLIFTVEDMTQPIEQISEISKLRQAAINEIEERKRIESELLQTRKHESIGTLSQGFAHDFNNILAVIEGNISLLKLTAKLDPKSQQILENIENSVFKGSSLANRLITMSNYDESLIEKSPVNIATIISKIRKPDSDKTIALNTEISDGVYLIHGNEAQLVEMLNTILQNAYESIESEGNIELMVQNVQLPEDNPLNIPEGAYINIEVRDDGIGIPDKNLDKVFDPYFSTKHQFSRKGLGFGLSIANSIARKHRGHISIRSEEKKGTTVSILLQPYLEQ